MRGATTITTILAASSLLILAACTGEVHPEPTVEEIPTGLTIDSAEDHYAAGTYVVDGLGIRFEASIADGIETVRYMDMDGNELFRSELHGDAQVLAEERRDDTKWGMWHYGVKGNPDVPMEDQPEVMAWINGEHAQLAALLWRELQAQDIHETGALNGVFRYGVHLDEALAFDNEVEIDPEGTAEDVDAEARCSCYGKCGPGCFSVGSNWYCRKHDCCCRVYGNWACYSWCFAYPKCPAAPC